MVEYKLRLKVVVLALLVVVMTLTASRTKGYVVQFYELLSDGTAHAVARGGQLQSNSEQRKLSASEAYDLVLNSLSINQEELELISFDEKGKEQLSGYSLISYGIKLKGTYHSILEAVNQLEKQTLVSGAWVVGLNLQTDKKMKSRINGELEIKILSKDN